MSTGTTGTTLSNSKPQTKGQLVVALMDAVIEAVSVADVNIGAPGGVMYAAMCQVVTLEQFTRLMDGMVHAGLLRKQGQCYFLTERGTAWYQQRQRS